jgi:hypothetical protein
MGGGVKKTWRPCAPSSYLPVAQEDAVAQRHSGHSGTRSTENRISLDPVTKRARKVAVSMLKYAESRRFVLVQLGALAVSRTNYGTSYLA